MGAESLPKHVGVACRRLEPMPSEACARIGLRRVMLIHSVSRAEERERSLSIEAVAESRDGHEEVVVNVSRTPTADSGLHRCGTKRLHTALFLATRV